MMERSTGIEIEVGVVSDRGLNERRPLNEDSYLSDAGRGIFAVADGVGGAEAGEVASKTAIEVLEEAFRHQREDDDVEDLMEIAIQRANASIFRMSREHPKFAMMATTIVALHVDGLRCTAGHVGDSRLYSIAADGTLRRETEDHSVVEEEVRAGRMTPEQAQNHPSRNVISRALGAEQDVEVDLKTFEVANGTTFLLCTDGITRHIPDNEIRSIIGGFPDPQAACEEMKRLCFERGAEDNLTAVVVRVGGAAARVSAVERDEVQTIIAERAMPAGGASSLPSQSDSSHLHRPLGETDRPSPTAHASDRQSDNSGERNSTQKMNSPHQQAAKKRGGAGGVLLTLFLLTAFSAAAFYGGMIYGKRQVSSAATLVPAHSSPSPQRPEATPQPVSTEEMRAKVDMSARAEAERMAADLNAQPTKGDDPSFRYLYGRALLLSDRSKEALEQFEKSVAIVGAEPSSTNSRLRADAYLATAAAALRANEPWKARAALEEMLKSYQATDSTTSPSPGATPPPPQ